MRQSGLSCTYAASATAARRGPCAAPERRPARSGRGPSHAARLNRLVLSGLAAGVLAALATTLPTKSGVDPTFRAIESR